MAAKDFFLTKVHPEWYDLVCSALAQMDKTYLDDLFNERFEYLPNGSRLFAAFSMPLSSVQYLLLGESPYPRVESANGHAFWDDKVDALWSDTGLSKTVNRATSLRNILKMLLHARGDLQEDFSQDAIARLDKRLYHKTAAELFQHLINRGFMLLNASLVYEKGRVNYHAKHWAPFMYHLLDELQVAKPTVQLVLFGKIAEKIPGYTRFTHLLAEHPYNLSFIQNQDVIQFFKPLDLLLSE